MTIYFDHYHPTPTAVKPKLHLEVEVRHTDGGMSFMDGRRRKRGLVLGLKHMDIERNSDGRVTSKGYMLFGDDGEISINFHVQSFDRRNPRKGDALAKWIAARLPEIIPMALAQKWPELDAFLTTYPAHDRHPALV